MNNTIKLVAVCVAAPVVALGVAAPNRVGSPGQQLQSLMPSRRC
jgi:hypothetical protein